MLNNFKKGLLVYLLFLCVSLILPNMTLASYPQPQPPARQILVNKLVFNPAIKQFVDNLGLDQHMFLPEQEVTFRIEVKNTSNVDLTNIKVKDKLPQQLNFVTGPGTFDDNTNTLSFTIDKLSPGETKKFDFKAKVVSEKGLNVNVSCITNLAEARVDELMDQDSASICLQKKVLGVTKELPKTGVDKFTLTLIASTLGIGLSSWLLRKSFTSK